MAKKLRWMRSDGTEGREFGKDIPASTLAGPITLQNYELRVEHYGANVKLWGTGNPWPYLSNQNGLSDTADRGAWELYFRDHLEDFPSSFKLFRDGIIEHWNAPDVLPELFDPDYRPKIVSLFR